MPVKERFARMTRRGFVLVAAATACWPANGGAQYSYVPSPPPCPAPPATLPQPLRSAANRVTVGVLALHLQRASPELRYLADAFPDAIAHRLVLLERVRLFAPSAVRRLPPTSAPNAVRVARELRTRFLVSGALSVEGGTPTLTIVLYDSASTEPAWTRAFRADAEAVLKAESVVASEVAQRLLPTLTEAERVALSREFTRSPQAFAAFLRGEDAARERGMGYAARAVAFYDEAVRADSNFAEAHSELAMSLLAAVEEGAREAMANPDSIVALAVKESGRSTALRPKSARAWSARGAALSFSPASAKEARAAFERARGLAPLDPEVAYRHARALLRMGSKREAEEALTSALREAPGFASALFELGDLSLLARNTERACSWLNAAIAADPYRPMSYALRAIARRGEMENRLGWADAEIAVRLGARPHGEAAAALVDLRSGDSVRARGRALKLFREFDRRSMIGVSDARFVSLSLVAVGERARAISILERARPRDGALRLVLQDPAFSSLRSDERFRRAISATANTIGPVGGRGGP